MENKIIKTNKIRCRKCGDIIESTSVHDFKFCSCGACAVDGGKGYLRRVGEREDWVRYGMDGSRGLQVLFPAHTGSCCKSTASGLFIALKPSKSPK